MVDVLSEVTKSDLNTIYIISKGRPKCQTAKTLEKMEYPGEWFIVCGNNDETIDEYIDNWGSDKVLVFDWYEEINSTDTLDNFGFDNMPSGAVPVRNATCRIARERGELRHWQFDDDYNSFRKTDYKTKKKVAMTGEEFEEELFKLAKFGYDASIQNVGFALATIESVPENAKTFGRRVFNAHNMPTDEKLFTKWRSRLNDDLINAIDTWNSGGYEILFKHICLGMNPSQSEDGGLTDIYQAEGTVRKSAYPVLVAPSAVQLVVKFGRYHHHVNWNRICPKLISEEWKKQ